MTADIHELMQREGVREAFEAGEDMATATAYQVMMALREYESGEIAASIKRLNLDDAECKIIAAYMVAMWLGQLCKTLADLAQSYIEEAQLAALATLGGDDARH